MTSGLVNASFSLPEWQAGKMIVFAPCCEWQNNSFISNKCKRRISPKVLYQTLHQQKWTLKNFYTNKLSKIWISIHFDLFMFVHGTHAFFCSCHVIYTFHTIWWQFSLFEFCNIFDTVPLKFLMEFSNLLIINKFENSFRNFNGAVSKMLQNSCSQKPIKLIIAIWLSWMNLDETPDKTPPVFYLRWYMPFNWDQTLAF